MLYVWGISYLALPYTPIGEVLSSAHMVHYAALAPFWLKLTLKAPLAAAASYHTWNGFRHLAWDMGYCESLCIGSVLRSFSTDPSSSFPS